MPISLLFPHGTRQQRKLGEICPLKAPMTLNNLNNLFFPPSGNQKLHMAGVPERINPSCLKTTAEKTRGSKQPLETVLCHANPPQKLSRLTPNSAAVPPKSTAKFATCVLLTLLQRLVTTEHQCWHQTQDVKQNNFLH